MEQWLGWWPWVLLLVVLALAMWGLRPAATKTPVHRKSVESLLDTPTRRLMIALRFAIRDRWLLFSQLSADRLLASDSRVGLPAPVIFDFVLADRETCRPLVVIRLERDPSAADYDLWEEALVAAGLAVIRVPLAEDFEIEVLRSSIEKAMG